MVDGLVETSLLIDILRGYALADQWLEQQTERLGITRFVWLEVLQGAENRANYQRSIALLKAFELIDVTPTDIEWATEQMLKLTLRYHTEAVNDPRINPGASQATLVLPTTTLAPERGKPAHFGTADTRR